MEKVLKIVFIEIFSKQKTLDEKNPRPPKRFTCLTLHGWAFSLTDFPKCLKNLFFPKFLVNPLKVDPEKHAQSKINEWTERKQRMQLKKKILIMSLLVA